jgi:hypothetical protein
MSYSINIIRGHAVSIQDGTTSIPIASENTDYQAVLDAIIAEGTDCFDGDIPAEVQAAADEKQFNQQLAAYRVAVARLAQYVLADGRAEVTEMQDSLIQLTDSDGMPQFDSDGSPIYEQIEVITVTAIDPVEPTIERTVYSNEDPMAEPTTETIENPLITKDNEERAAAQDVINNTEQAVIDHYEANQ